MKYDTIKKHYLFIWKKYKVKLETNKKYAIDKSELNHRNQLLIKRAFIKIQESMKIVKTINKSRCYV